MYDNAKRVECQRFRLVCRLWALRLFDLDLSPPLTNTPPPHAPTDSYSPHCIMVLYWCFRRSGAEGFRVIIIIVITIITMTTIITIRVFKGLL